MNKCKILVCENNCCSLTYNVIKKSKPCFTQLNRPKRAGIIVFKKNKILLSQSYNEFWGIPKGSIENESAKHAAVRETFEETGIIVDENNVIYAMKLNDYRTTFFLVKLEKSCSLPNDPFDLKCESTGFGWINPYCLLQMVKNNIIKLNRVTKIAISKIMSYNWKYLKDYYNIKINLVGEILVKNTITIGISCTNLGQTWAFERMVYNLYDINNNNIVLCLKDIDPLKIRDFVFGETSICKKNSVQITDNTNLVLVLKNLLNSEQNWSYIIIDTLPNKLKLVKHTSYLYSIFDEKNKIIGFVTNQNNISLVCDNLTNLCFSIMIGDEPKRGFL